MLEYFPDNYDFRFFFRYIFFMCIPSFFYKFILSYKYKKFFNKSLNLKNPKALSEKIQWIKLYGLTDSKKKLSDKLFVKEFVSSKVPELKCAKVFQVAKSFDKLNFSNLPKKFILKTNHAWKTNVVVKDKNLLEKGDFNKIEKFFRKVLRVDYSRWSYYELQYRGIVPKIYAEELLGDKFDVVDYEVWCFNGKPEFISYKYAVKKDGYCVLENYFFDKNWQPLNFHFDYVNGNTKRLSKNKDKILKYAEILAKDIDFVRVDFMEIVDEIYFCEMTFTPSSGFFKIYPQDKDLFLGEKLMLS